MATAQIRPLPDSRPRHWTQLLQSAFRQVQALLDFLELDASALPDPAIADSDFPVLVPRGFAGRMRKRDPSDPLLRQVLPILRERDRAPGYAADPLDEVARSTQGLVRKYAGRALLITTAACPVHCRYCFRRHFPYADHAASKSSWASALAALADAAEISEVILSGGDPFSLSNQRLAILIEGLAGIAHIDTLRIHSRYPIVLPERIDDDLIRVITGSRLRCVLVVHCNHAQEVDHAVASAFGALRASGVVLLNQSVLLRGVNDDVATLCALSRQLFDAGALPYYLHALDPVDGSAHFEVPEPRAVELVAGMRSALPGYLVPRLAREIAGGSSKTVLA